MKKKILLFMILIFLPVFLSLGLSRMKLEKGVEDNRDPSEAFYKETKINNQRVLVYMRGLYKEIPLEEYVIGVVAGKYSEQYEDKLLEALAISVRTDILKSIEQTQSNQGDILGFRYYTKEERKELWGADLYEKKEEKIESAVGKTAGQVIIYMEDSKNGKKIGVSAQKDN